MENRALYRQRGSYGESFFVEDHMGIVKMEDYMGVGPKVLTPSEILKNILVQLKVHLLELR